MHFYPEIRTAEDTGSARLAEGLQLEVESDLGLRNMDIEHGKVETIGEESVLPMATKGLGPTGLEETAETERPRERPPAPRSLQQASMREMIVERCGFREPFRNRGNFQTS